MSQKTIRKKPRKSHRFRFHLLHKWMTENFKPCKVADIGGGKGILAYLLNESGWEATVIDPFHQILPRTFKDLEKNRTTLTPDQRKSLKRVDEEFEEEMAKDYDLLVGLHAHGSNMKIINACKKYRKNFVILPCCVIGEPINIEPDVNWLDSLEVYAKGLGLDVGRAQLDFRGQNIILYSRI